MHEMLLESADKDVRIAAGENIGLMFETANIFLGADVSLFFFLFLTMYLIDVS